MAQQRPGRLSPDRTRVGCWPWEQVGRRGHDSRSQTHSATGGQHSGRAGGASFNTESTGQPESAVPAALGRHRTSAQAAGATVTEMTPSQTVETAREQHPTFGTVTSHTGGVTTTTRSAGEHGHPLRRSY